MPGRQGLKNVKGFSDSPFRSTYSRNVDESPYRFLFLSKSLYLFQNNFRHLTILKRLRSLYATSMLAWPILPQLSLAREGAPTAAQLRALLIEDRALDGSPGYIEFLMTVHKTVQKML